LGTAAAEDSTAEPSKTAIEAALNPTILLFRLVAGVIDYEG
jgi:hypothetical protein